MVFPILGYQCSNPDRSYSARRIVEAGVPAGRGHRAGVSPAHQMPPRVTEFSEIAQAEYSPHVLFICAVCQGNDHAEVCLTQRVVRVGRLASGHLDAWD